MTSLADARTTVRPVTDWVAVAPLETEEFEVGGIVLMRGYAFRSFCARVVAKADGASPDLQVGDLVWYEAYSGHPHQSAPLSGKVFGVPEVEHIILVRPGTETSSSALDALCQNMLKRAAHWTEAERVQYQRLEDKLESLAKNRRTLAGQTSQPKAGIFAKGPQDALEPMPGWIICEEEPVERSQGALFAGEGQPTYKVLSVAQGAPVAPGNRVTAYPYSGVVVGHASSKVIALRFEELLACVEG